jgi:hypothetical protein
MRERIDVAKLYRRAIFQVSHVFPPTILVSLCLYAARARVAKILRTGSHRPAFIPRAGESGMFSLSDGKIA